MFRKNSTSPISSISMYTMALQYLVERFNCFLEETSQGLVEGFEAQPYHGVIIVDSRLKTLDLNVAVSHLSFIFGNPIGQKCLRMIEAPTFTFSQLSVGLQLTDIFAAGIYSKMYRRHCHEIAGGHDYTHMAYFAGYADRLEFRSRMDYAGHHVRGYRFINFSDAT